MKFAMCNEFCDGWPVADAIRLARDTGYDGIEIAPFTIAEDVRRVPAAVRDGLRAEAERCGVAVVGLHWLLVKPGGLYINHPDVGVRQRTVEYLVSLVHFCADLGGDRMVVGSPKQRNVVSGCTPAQAWDWARETFAAVLPTAAERGVRLCIEPLARCETDFINTVAEGLRLVAEMGHPCFQVHLDVKAMCDEGRPLGAIIREAVGRVGHLHVNDANRNGPGWGDTDYGPVVSALRDIGYDDFASVEVFDFSPGAARIAASSLAFLESAFGRNT